MKKPDFLNALRARGYSAAEANTVLTDLQEIAAAQLSAGQGFTVPGVVALTVVQRAPRSARNPKTGEEVQVPARATITAKIPGSMKALLRA